MASTAVNVPNPVNTPTAVQLAQVAANIATVITQGCRNGNYEDIYDYVNDLAAAINCLAQCLITINNTTASSVGVVNTRNTYALGAGAVVPANINTAAV
jgi:hypothetical protein